MTRKKRGKKRKRFDMGKSKSTEESLDDLKIELEDAKREFAETELLWNESRESLSETSILLIDLWNAKENARFAVEALECSIENHDENKC
jgi:hypothetical protein